MECYLFSITIVFNFSTILRIDTDETPDASETRVICPPRIDETTPATIVLGVCYISGRVWSFNTIASRSVSDKSISEQIRSAMPS